MELQIGMYVWLIKYLLQIIQIFVYLYIYGFNFVKKNPVFSYTLNRIQLTKERVENICFHLRI